MTEEWKPIPDFPDYLVSSYGRVLSLKNRKPKLRKLVSHTQGYLQLSLCKSGKKLIRLVHSLVAEAFLGPRPPGGEVCHGPGGKLDNSVGNLSYGTRSDNQMDRVRDGVSNRGERHGKHKLTRDQVIAIRKDFRSQRIIAKEYGVAQRTVFSIKRGEKWSWLQESKETNNAN